MTLHDATYAGPAVHKTSEANPAKIILELMDQNPGARRDQLMAMFRERMRDLIPDEPEFITPLADRYFYHEYNNILGYRRRAEQQSSGSTRKAKAEFKTKVKAAKKRIAAAILDTILPTGKPARDSTFADCKRAGGFWLKVAAKGKPSQIVGEVLSDKQVAALWRTSHA